MRLLPLFYMACIWPLAAQAEIYKSVDRDGHVTYSSSPIKGSKRIILEPSSGNSSSSISSESQRPRATATPRDFPRVDGATQRNRDDTRRKILEDELAAEGRLLEEAVKAQKEGEANPEVFRGKDGKVYRNVAKFDEKMKPLNEQVDLHQKNIEALKTELSKLK